MFASERARALRAAELATGVLQVDDDSAGVEIEVNVNDIPFVAEPKK